MVIYYPGVWDLLHIGHLNAIRAATIDPDGIIIGVCSDRLNLVLKHSECVNNENERLALIKSLKGVRDAFIYNTTNYPDHILDTNIDVFVCGPEFGNRIDQEKSLELLRAKGTVIFRTERTPNISTTELKERIKKI